jgi:DNA polymerase III delta subunit
VQALAQRVGGDLLQASQEIDKLIAFTAPLYGITLADVELLVADVSEIRAYELADAVTSKQAARVVDLTDRLLADGQAPEQLLAVVGGRIRDLSLLASARAEGVSSDRVATAAGWQAWRLRQLERSLGSFTRSELIRAQEVLVVTDLALKTRPTHERSVVALLAVLAIAQRAEPRALTAAFAY